MKEKILAIIGVIILIVCIVLAGCIDSEEKRYVESSPEANLRNSIIHH